MREEREPRIAQSRYIDILPPTVDPAQNEVAAYVGKPVVDRSSSPSAANLACDLNYRRA